MKYEALNDTVVLKEKGKEGEMLVCSVVKVGPGLLTMAGRIPPDVRVGDIVLVPPYKPNKWIWDDGNVLLLVKQHQLRIQVISYEKPK